MKLAIEGKERGLDMGMLIEVMHSLTYLKIICSQELSKKVMMRYKEVVER